MLKKVFVKLGLLVAGTTMAVAGTGCDSFTTAIQDLLGNIQLPV